MGMDWDTIKKIKGKAIWEHEHEFTTERLTCQKNGVWRYEDENGGANGAYESRGTEVRTLDAQEAVNMLRAWGVTEAVIAEVADLAELTAADTE